MTMTMTRDELRSAVCAMLQRIAPETRTEALAGDRPLREQIDLDSMDWLNVLAGLKERFGVDVDESDYRRLQTLDAMLDYLATRLSAMPRG